MMGSENAKGTDWHVRPVRDEDRAAVLDLAPRLAIGIAPWRGDEGMVAAARRWIEEALGGVGAERAVFVAECGGSVVGFASVVEQTEFTGEAQAYLGELAVAETAEGVGIGRALLAAVESWASARGLGLIVLDTGTANARARDFYARGEFVEESVRLTKVVKRMDPT